MTIPSKLYIYIRLHIDDLLKSRLIGKIHYANSRQETTTSAPQPPAADYNSS